MTVRGAGWGELTNDNTTSALRAVKLVGLEDGA